MTARLSMSGRVGLIVVVAFLATWLGLVASAYLLNERGHGAVLPSPDRLAALASLVEPAGAADRVRILAAVRTSNFSAQIVSEPRVTALAPDSPRADPETVAAYEAELDGRPVTVIPQTVRTRYPYILAKALNTVEIRIGLATGETLVIVSESPFIVDFIGLPLGFAAALLGILVALATLIALHREFRPLSRLAAAVDTVDPSGEPATLPPVRARSPELKALIAAFERLQGRIATLIRARMALIGGIQHDLRTFATRLRLRIDKIADAEERARAATDIADMIALLDDALLASRAGASELDQELIELAPLIEAEVADRRAAGASIALTTKLEHAEAVVLGDRLALRRIAANLIDNALKYGGAAHVTLAVQSNAIALTVDDEGPGVPPDLRAFLLEPFTRLEASRARATGGAGLGLAITRSLVAAHGGELTIDDAPSGGARLRVLLPLFSP